MANHISNPAMPKPSIWALGILVLGGCCLGVAPVVVKSIEFSPEVSAFYRVALSVPFFVASTAFVARSQGLNKSSETGSKATTASINILCLVTAFFFAADLVVMHIAIRYADVAVATLLTNCAPFFVGVLGALGFTKMPRKQFWIMLPIALGGCALLIGVPKAGSSQFSGSLLALAAAFFYACYLVGVSKLRLRGVVTSKIMLWVTAISTVFIFPLFAWQGFPLPQSIQTIVLLAVLVLIGQILGQGLVTLALQELPASLSSLVLLVQPVVAGVLSWAFLSEYLSSIQIIGIVIVLSAIAGATLLPSAVFQSNERNVCLPDSQRRGAPTDIQ